MAKLTALLSLNTANFQSGVKNAKASVTSLKNSTKVLADGSGFAKMGGALKSVAKGAAVITAAVAAAGAAVGALSYKLLLAGEAANSADARVRNIAKSMGLFGNESDAVAERLNNLADKIELQTGVDGDSIQITQSKLLTFKELAKTADEVGGSFDRATMAAVDMAAAGFGSAEQNATQLGKALNDPINGINAMTRSGITFTEEEKEKIKTLVESNRMIEAQGMVLSAIEKQVGGTAVATAQASVQIKAALAQGFDEVGKPLADALADFAPKFLEFMESVKPKLAEAGQFMVAIFRSGEALNLVWNSMKLAFSMAVNHLWAQLRATIAAIGQYIVEVFKTAVTYFQILTTADFWKGMGKALIAIFLTSVSFLQKGLAEALEIARPLAELLGQDGKIDSAQGAIRQSASILDEEAASLFADASDLLAPAAQKVAQRLAEAGQNIATRFNDTYANTAEIIDTSGMRKELSATVERIKQAVPPAKEGKKIGVAGVDEKPKATAIAAVGGSGQLGSFAQSMNMLFGRSANAGLLEENKRQTDWLKKIHDNTKNKGTTPAPAEAVFA